MSASIPAGTSQRGLNEHPHGGETAHLHVVESHARLEDRPEDPLKLHEPVDDGMGQGDETQEPEALPPNLAGQGTERFEGLHKGAPNQAAADIGRPM